MLTPLRHLSGFGHKLDGSFNRYKAVVYPGRYLEYRRWLTQQQAELPIDKPLVVFDFRDSRIDGPQGRRFYTLFMYFVRAGFYPVLRENYLVLGNIQEKHKRYCLRESFSVLRDSQRLPGAYLLVTDKWYSNLAARASRVININYRPGYQPSDDCFPMPFPMFSPIYAAAQDRQLAQYRAQTRQWGVFFGGDAKPDKYNKSAMRAIYQKLSRAQILAQLQAGLAPEALLTLNSQTQLERALMSEYSGVVLMNTRDCQVASEDWLATMARARFFLACPGVRYPMSHNLIEAMAVGTVPITQYPEMFFPPLEHGKNCLVFNSPEELEQQVQAAIAMPEAERLALVAGAQAYYDTYLAPEVCIDRLLEKPGRNISLRLLPFLKEGGGFA